MKRIFYLLVSSPSQSFTQAIWQAQVDCLWSTKQNPESFFMATIKPEQENRLFWGLIESEEIEFKKSSPEKLTGTHVI